MYSPIMSPTDFGITNILPTSAMLNFVSVAYVRYHWITWLRRSRLNLAWSKKSFTNLLLFSDRFILWPCDNGVVLLLSLLHFVLHYETFVPLHYLNFKTPNSEQYFDPSVPID